MKQFLKNLKRAWDYAVIGWSNYDWDSGYLYEFMLFKLKRMQVELINGVAIHDKTTLQSLRICIKLLERITKESYDYNLDKHDAKWGSAEFKAEPNPNSDWHRVVITRKNVTEETMEQERLEFLEACNKDYKSEQRDMRLLHDIMKKYSKTWWD